MTTKFCSKVKHFLVLRYRDQSNLAERRNPLSVQINALCSLCYWKSISCILKCYSALHRSVKLFQMKKKKKNKKTFSNLRPINVRTSCLDHSFLTQYKFLESFSSIAPYYCESKTTGNIRNISVVLMCCKEKSNQR